MFILKIIKDASRGFEWKISNSSSATVGSKATKFFQRQHASLRDVFFHLGREAASDAEQAKIKINAIER
jgi:hypothetical protein